MCPEKKTISPTGHCWASGVTGLVPTTPWVAALVRARSTELQHAIGSRREGSPVLGLVPVCVQAPWSCQFKVTWTVPMGSVRVDPVGSEIQFGKVSGPPSCLSTGYIKNTSCTREKGGGATGTDSGESGKQEALTSVARRGQQGQGRLRTSRRPWPGNSRMWYDVDGEQNQESKRGAARLAKTNRQHIAATIKLAVIETGFTPVRFEAAPQPRRVPPTLKMKEVDNHTLATRVVLSSLLLLLSRNLEGEELRS